MVLSYGFCIDVLRRYNDVVSRMRFFSRNWLGVVEIVGNFLVVGFVILGVFMKKVIVMR